MTRERLVKIEWVKGKVLSTDDLSTDMDLDIYPIILIFIFVAIIFIILLKRQKKKSEVLKYGEVKSITLVDIDPEMTRLAKQHPVLTRINQGAMKDNRVKVVNQDARAFLYNDTEFYGVIIIDLPDPDDVDLMHLYSQGFYALANLNPIVRSRNDRSHLFSMENASLLNKTSPAIAGLVLFRS